MPTARTIKAGIPASLTGQFSVQGKQALVGLQAWAEDANRSGGLIVDGPGKRWPVAVIHYDDQSKPDCTRQATSRLIEQDCVDLLFGPYSSVLSLAAAGVAEEYQRVFWNQGGAADNIYQQGFRWIVGVLTPASGYLAGLLPLVRQADSSASKIGIIRAFPGGFPKSVSETVSEQAKGLGFRVQYLREFPAELKDFNEILEEVRDERLDVLVAVGRIANDIQLAKQLVSHPIEIKAVAVVAAPIQQFRDALGEHVQGFTGPSQWEPEANYPNDYGQTADSVMASLRRQSTGIVDYPMVQAYAAGLVAQACLEQAGSLEDAELRKAASDLDISTFYGRFKIDPDTGKQVGRSTLLVQWQDGKKVALWPPEQAQGNLVYPWPRG
ncbi:MAG: hypothetical protein BZY81_08795 [SAR202 cluster bacterium Io17-Chloro-G4]|nr:MAG: hypothetical protein BZY81_08795 [SAR202 cluster bacterium Io17-Chloro-G4]